MKPPRMRDSKWLADRLGLSITTLERMRAEKSKDLPPHIKLGTVYRYDYKYVDWWIQKRLNPEIEPFEEWNLKNATPLT